MSNSPAIRGGIGVGLPMRVAKSLDAAVEDETIWSSS